MKGIRDDHPTLVSNKHASFNTIYAKPTDFTTVDLYKLFNELLNDLRTIEVLYASSAVNKEQKKSSSLTNNKNNNSNNKKIDYEFYLLKNFPPSGPKGTISKFIKD